MGTIFKTEKISKIYSGNRVLNNINIELYEGEVVGLIGENGAGKSTLLKIISGAEEASEGTMEMNGRLYAPKAVIEANKQGIGMVFQEQSLIGNLTVAQNIYLGREEKYKKFGIINRSFMNKDAKKSLESVGVDNVEPNKKVRDIDFATRQMVEIAKVLDIVFECSKNSSIILLDEPTTVLSDNEIEKLFVQIKKMKEKGNAVVFISHRLDEVLKVTDRIYVFKDGENTAVLNTKDANEFLLYEKMVGRSTTGKFFMTDRQTNPSDEIVLEAKNLSMFGMFKNINFKLRKGEILGFCGVEGSGKEDLCSVLCGDEKQTSGTLECFGKKVSFSSPKEALRMGIICVPKERRDEGIIGLLSIKDNIAISSYKHLSNFGIISARKTFSESVDIVKKVGVKCRSVNDRVNQLSGGNAQKVIFARALESGAGIIILNHPTRGVDVGSKEEIYKLIRDAVEKGISVILLGDTLDECIELSNRVITLKDGMRSGEFECPPNKKPSHIEVVKKMM